MLEFESDAAFWRAIVAKELHLEDFLSENNKYALKISEAKNFSDDRKLELIFDHFKNFATVGELKIPAFEH